MNPITSDGNLVSIDIGTLNCMQNPYVVQLAKQKVIVRFKCSARDGDHGKMTLENVEN